MASIVMLAQACETIEFEAEADAEFVLGSAVPHHYDLVLGSHSVHTNPEALREAQARISAIESRLYTAASFTDRHIREISK